MHRQNPCSAYLWDTLRGFWWRAIFEQLHMSTDGKVCVCVCLCVLGGGGVARTHMSTVTHMHQTCTKIEVRFVGATKPPGRLIQFHKPMY